jgi:hypothetical protein
MGEGNIARDPDMAFEISFMDVLAVSKFIHVVILHSNFKR